MSHKLEHGSRNYIEPDNQTQQDQCIKHHPFTSFIAAFLDHAISYITPLSQIEIIDCKMEGSTLEYTFASTMISESTMVENMNIFKDLNINQFGLEKDAWR